MRILHLNLEDKWYNLISSGEKKFEYREVKLHWTERLFKKNGKPKSFDVIKFTRANYIDPFFIDFLEIVGIEDFQGKPHYKIKLGGMRDPSELFPRQLTLDFEAKKRIKEATGVKEIDTGDEVQNLEVSN